MAWIEDAARRSRKAKIYTDDANPTRRRLEAFVDDRHYHDGTTWQEVDDSITDDTMSGFAHKADRMRHAIHIGATGTRRWMPRRDHPTEYIEFGRLQSYSGTAWGNVNLGTPTRSANQIKWTTANFELTLQVSWRHVKIIAVLKTENARRRLRWAVSLSGLTYSGGILRSTTDNQIVGSVDLPIAWDANGSWEQPNVQITTTYSGGFLEFGGNLAGAVLPITIDPTLTTPQDNTIGCTYVASGAADNNFGASTNIGCSQGTRTPLVRFDLSSIAASATCDSATLYLTSFSSVATSDQTVHAILSASGSWAEGTGNNAAATSGQSSWNYQVYNTTRWAGDTGSNGGTDAGCSVSGTDYGSTAIGTISYPNSSQNTEASCALTASAVEDWFGVTNYGIVLVGADTTNRNWHSDDATTSTYRPKLVVVYTEATSPVTVNLNAAEITAGPQTTSVTPGAVSVTVSAATITADPQAVTVTPGAVTVTVNAAAVTAEPQTSSITPGAVTVTVNAAALTAGPQTATITPGAVTVTVNAAAISAAPGAVTVDDGAIAPTTVTVNAATITAGPQGVTITPGAVSVTLGAATITAAPGTVTPANSVSVAARDNAIFVRFADPRRKITHIDARSMPRYQGRGAMFERPEFYINKVLATETANLIGYWPLHETSGTTITDHSTQANNGDTSGVVTLGQTGIGDGQTSILLGGGFVNVYSSALNTDFIANGTEGALMIWINPAATWADGTLRYFTVFRSTDNNRIGIQKTAASLLNFVFVTGGTNKSIAVSIAAPSAWTQLALSWSRTGNYLRAYVNGAQVGTTQTSLGAWSGNLSSTSGALLGALSTVPASVWNGYLAHAALWNKALTTAQILALSYVNPPVTPADTDPVTEHSTARRIYVEGS